MDLKDQLKQIGDSVARLKASIMTEEATKTSFVMPFLSALGYNVFNPHEVNPEYICDVGIKKGEKIDYAIMLEGNPTILIECKHWSKPLEPHDGQLLRYYHVSPAKFAILTNGVVYRFYTDLVSPNRMDKKPFLEFNVTELRENQIDEIKKFHKSYFNVESILNTASELKYLNELKNCLAEEFTNPSSDFVKHFAWKVYEGVINAKQLEYFTGITKRATQQFLSDLITERLKAVLDRENQPSTEEPPIPIDSSPKIETTAEEIEAFLIVRAILRAKITGSRIVSRDAQSYFSVLLDDNNRKPICRLYLNGIKKSIGVFDTERMETKHEIKSLDDIYNFSKELMSIIEVYISAKDVDPIVN